jgi:hypothetical protein
MASKFFKAGAKVFEYLKPKPKVNKTKLDKAKSDLNIAIQKTKGSKAKLKQTLFEIENKMPLTFKKKSGKSESNKEAYKRIQKDNTKVIGKMFKKAIEGKKDGGRMGLKDGSKKSGFGAQSVKYGLDKNYGVTKADKIAKFVSKKNKKKII